MHIAPSGVYTDFFTPPNMSMRKVTKTRGSFPTEEAAIKLLYMVLARVVAKWETVQHWKQMLNYLDTVCSDRIREAGVRQ